MSLEINKNLIICVLDSSNNDTPSIFSFNKELSIDDVKSTFPQSSHSKTSQSIVDHHGYLSKESEQKYISPPQKRKIGEEEVSSDEEYVPDENIYESSDYEESPFEDEDDLNEPVENNTETTKQQKKKKHVRRKKIIDDGNFNSYKERIR